MTIQARVANRLILAASLVWTAWVVSHYFVIPSDLFVGVEGTLRAAVYWREALWRTLRAVLGASMVVLAAWACGVTVFRSAVPTTTGERIVIRLAIGFAVLAYLLIALAFLHLFYPAVVLTVVTVAATTGALMVVRASTRPSTREIVCSLRASGRLTPVDRIYVVCIALALVCALVAALAPETEYDALWYHLWLPVKWLEAGRPVDIVEEYVSLYPLTWEMLYGAAMVVGGPVAAKLLHFLCLPLLGGTVAMLARRLFPEASAALAAALIITTPFVLWEGTTAYVDLALAWYVTLAIYAIVRYNESHQLLWVIVGAGMLGVALAIKHLAIVVLLLAGAALLWRETNRAGAAAAVRTLALFASIAILPPAPWYARAYFASGNPLFPEMYSVFGAQPPERWTIDSERALQGFKDRFGSPRTVRTMALLPWDVTVHGARYSGALGPLFLILVPLAAFSRRRGRAVMTMAACAAYGAFWASPFSSFQMRFLLPALPLAAVLGAEGAARIARTIPRRAGAVVAGPIFALLVMNLPPMVSWHERDRAGWSGWLSEVIRGLPVPVVIGAESEREYLARVVPTFRAWEFIDRHLPGDSRVVAFASGDLLYASRPRIWSDSIAAGRLTWATPAGDETSALHAAERLHVTHVLFDKRQLLDGSVTALAIGSERMRSCCLRWLYEDDRYVLYAIEHNRRPDS